MEPTNQIPESHVRLYATPTEGVPAEHSHYYRRLISAGYKGYIQGNIAGATLYGVMGAAVGSAVGLALLPFGIPSPFLAVPVMAGLGVMKGADSFGKIGSSAAQLAEFAETNERRRALLDRLDATPSKEEAEEIKRLLQEDTIETTPAHFFHWKTALMGALIGAAIFAGLAALAASGILPHGLESLAEPLLQGTHAAEGITKLVAIAGTIGAGVGSMIGLDRGWIRRWFTLSENTIHDRQYYQSHSQQRAQEVARLNAISQKELQESHTSDQPNHAPHSGNQPPREIKSVLQDDRQKPSLEYAQPAQGNIAQGLVRRETPHLTAVPFSTLTQQTGIQPRPQTLEDGSYRDISAAPRGQIIGLKTLEEPLQLPRFATPAV